MRERPRSRVRASRPARRAEPAFSSGAVELVLVWTARELLAERAFPWYRSRRPAAFVRACAPSAN